MFGIRDSHLRERLLRETSLTLKSCLDICRATKLSKERMKEIETPIAPAEVHAVKGNGTKLKTNPHSTQATPKMLTKNCMYCGYKHEASKTKCPAYGKTCLKCKEKDHFQSVCGQQTRPVQNYRRKPRKFNKKLHQVEDSESDSSEN